MGDDLIKVAMDRIKLEEKSRHMFYAKDGGGADRVTVMDGSLSPQGKHRKRPVVMKAELYGETT